jgi:hypothetical protein
MVVALKNVQLSENGIKRNSSGGRHGIVVVPAQYSLVPL